MKFQVYLGIACIVFITSIISEASSFNLVCYFSSWAIYRNYTGAKFDVTDIDPNLCTHVNFAFVVVYANGSLIIVDPWESNDDNEGGHYHGFQNLKQLKSYNPSLKVGISLGGWKEASVNFTIVAADPVKRKILVDDSLRLLEKYGFDAFDLDWEYPSLRGGKPEDKANFLELLKDYSAAMRPKGIILSAALASAIDKIDVAYDIPEITKYLDFLNIMTYDFHGSFDKFVGHISPLHASKEDYIHGRNATYVVATAIEYWLYKGADVSKINMGIPTYARTFTLEDPSNTGLYAPIKGPGEKGMFTSLEGTLGYNEVCYFHTNSDSTYYWDDSQKVPHRVTADQWIGFEDERSVQIKVDFAKSQGINGIMIWSLDTDDFYGLCGKRYPLTNAAKERLQYWKARETNIS